MHILKFVSDYDILCCCVGVINDDYSGLSSKNDRLNAALIIHFCMSWNDGAINCDHR